MTSAYLLGGLTKLADFPASVAEKQHFGLISLAGCKSIDNRTKHEQTGSAPKLQDSLESKRQCTRTEGAPLFAPTGRAWMIALGL